MRNEKYKESSEIQNIRHLLDIIERTLEGELTEQDVIELKRDVNSWEKDIEKLKKMIDSLNIDSLIQSRKIDVFRENSTSASYDISPKEYVQSELDEEDDEEFREQVSSFVKSMTECVDDFVSKVSAYEGEEELYEESDIRYPDPGDYDSGDYVYSTKAKAKTACKEAVEKVINDVKEDYGIERNNIVSYASEYFSGLEESFYGFMHEFSESYDEYASLECDGDAKKYILEKKSEFFSEKGMQKNVAQTDFKSAFNALANEILEIPMKKMLVVKEYFAKCTYEHDEDDEEYCFDIEDVCEKIYDDVTDFLKNAEKTFPNGVLNVYTNIIAAYCDTLKDKLMEL